jgi:hypothetical protein
MRRTSYAIPKHAARRTMDDALMFTIPSLVPFLVLFLVLSLRMGVFAVGFSFFLLLLPYGALK